ncbi:MobQ family relaxase [Paracoccus yeei]|uniref:MobQ family relaxase n=1 Tax=Paracoccus yeei TaxID=147645 RepID=UPI001C8F01A1|nr:MobQ family relaxase [Paracoccus yeei]MBY0138528.1 MobA/MobL family protein [Paracoccus yeei]
MASYHLSVKTIKRSAGRSATAAAAYRSGGVIACAREGRVHDYSAKRGIEACFILAPEGAPDWVRDRAALWNAAEARETRKNSVTAREWELALPAELGAEDRAGLVRDFGQALVARYGVVVDVALHAPHREGDQRNHHAHVLTTTRAIGTEGFGDKTRVLDAAKTGGVEIEALRAVWAEMQNRALERAGEAARVDHRSLEAQREAAQARGDALAAEALDRAPEIKLGPAANAMERRAQREADMNGSVYRPVTERGRAVQALRQAREALRQMRERVGQVQAVYAQARDRGQDRVAAGLAALRAAAARDGGGSLTERLTALLQDRRARDAAREGQQPSQSTQIQDGPQGRNIPVPDQERALAPASRPRNEQLLQALVQIANTAARGAQPRFTDAKAADAFFRDLRTSYGQDILSRIFQGDDQVLAGDFPKAEDRQQVARAITGIARAHGLEQDRRAAERGNGRPAKDRDTDWER